MNLSRLDILKGELMLDRSTFLEETKLEISSNKSFVSSDLQDSNDYEPTVIESFDDFQLDFNRLLDPRDSCNTLFNNYQFNEQ